ncbi:Sec-independent protein translocase subunit TatA [Actinokineospora soli]|uniref:Sec-independent protein translocase protein TatA n=1 Tax=Actinokineospora soli TaxID=1048753 RepID=A0ABW2TMC9_9PSEU
MNLGPWEILIIAVVIILLFGARKMPQMARSLGQSMRILKAETKGMRKDEDADAPAAQPEAATPPQQLAPAKPAQPEKTPSSSRPRSMS